MSITLLIPQDKSVKFYSDVNRVKFVLCCARFEVLTAMLMIPVFWNMMPCVSVHMLTVEWRRLCPLFQDGHQPQCHEVLNLKLGPPGKTYGEVPSETPLPLPIPRLNLRWWSKVPSEEGHHMGWSPPPPGRVGDVKD